MDYSSNNSADWSEDKANDVSLHKAKIAKKLEVQLKQRIFDGSHQTTALSFLPAI